MDKKSRKDNNRIAKYVFWSMGTIIVFLIAFAVRKNFYPETTNFEAIMSIVGTAVMLVICYIMVEFTQRIKGRRSYYYDEEENNEDESNE